LGGLAVDLQQKGDLAGAIEWVRRVQFVDPAPQGQLRFRDWQRLVVQTGAVQAEQIALQGE
jgi:hypothetical protein